MLLLCSPSTDASFNLALEEYMLLVKHQPAIILWRNDNAVIIGKNQNAYREIDLDFVKKNNISVIRRLSGGGAVFHDLGNINFSFIDTYEEGYFNNYTKFVSPICSFLQTLGANAQLSGRNDLLIDDKKISGNAMAVMGGNILSHGTLLYSADMSKLSGALKPKKFKISDTATKSVVSRVTNISSHINKKMDVTDFLEELYIYIKECTQGIEEYRLTNEDISQINFISESKYSTWEWNFGLSPDFNIEKAKRYSFGLVEISMNIKGMVIEDIKITGDFFGSQDISELEKSLRGIQYKKENLEKAIADIALGLYISGITKQEFLELIGETAQSEMHNI